MNQNLLYMATYTTGGTDGFITPPHINRVKSALAKNHGGYLETENLDRNGNGTLYWCDDCNDTLIIAVVKAPFFE